MLKKRDLYMAVGTPDAPGGLTRIAGQSFKNAKGAYAWKKALAAVEKELALIEKVKGEFVDRFAEKDADGKLVMVNDGKAVKLRDPAGFTAALTPLLDEDVTLDGVRPITLDELDGVDVSPNDLHTAAPFITEG